MASLDPKPIVAERVYDTVAIVRDAKPTRDELRRRLDTLSDLPRPRPGADAPLGDRESVP